MASTTSSSTSRLASSFIVQRACPSGAGAHVRATSCASCLPSSLRYCRPAGFFLCCFGFARCVRWECSASLSLSARAYHRVLKLARTIADLAEAEQIGPAQVAEALQYQPRSRRG